MEFGTHLFISYTHIDNERGWVTRFEDLITPLLKSRLGRNPNVWRDRKLGGNDVFADEIVHQIADCAVLLSVVSPRYVQSEWCLREASTFCVEAQRSGGAVVERKSRIVKVVLIPPDSQAALPAPMQDTLGFDFFELDGDDPVELDPRYGPEMAAKFELEGARLAGKISRMLKLLDTAPAPATPAAPVVTSAPAAATALPGKPAVYLAECGHDRRDDREALRSELESHGYPVRPDRNLPADEAGYRAEVARQLDGCALSIHLVGSGYGAVPDGPTEQSVVQLQNALAAQQARGGVLRRLISLPDGTRSANPLQQAFIEALHKDADLQFGANLITAERQTVVAEMHAALAALEAPAPAPAPEAALPAAFAELPRLYVICDKADLPASKPLRKSLERHFTVLKPVLEGDANAVRDANERWLAQCDAVLVYYGNATQTWKASVESDLLKAGSLRGGRPFRARFTWLAEPATDDKEDLSDPDDPWMIDARAGFSPALVEPIARALGQGHG